MKPFLPLFGRLISLALGLIFLVLAWLIYEQPLFRLLALAFALYMFYEFLTGYCAIYQRLRVKPAALLDKENLALVVIAGSQLVFAYEWLVAGYEKITGDFVVGITNTLAFFMSKNPYGWYQSFITNVATPYETWFAYAIEWSQLISGVLLALGAGLLIYGRAASSQRLAAVLSIIALVAAAFMNANFYLAAGWTSPSTHGINIVMFWLELIFIYWWINHFINPGKTAA